MLAGTGFCNDALLAHAFCEQSLAEGVVDFVRAGVEKVFALEINFCAAELLGQPLGVVESRGAAGEVVQQVIELSLECGVGFGAFVLLLLVR